MATRRAAEVSGIAHEYAKTDFYLLSADFHGTVRLALQHFIWQRALGYDIHPAVPKLDSTAAVADVACGTALWLIDVGRQLDSSCDLHGFDINPDQAPAKHWLAKNVHLHHWNVYDPVPQEFVGKFDLVHVRLISIVIKDNNPARIIQNLCKLLKPGGYLQWDEAVALRTFVVKPRPELTAPGMDALCTWYRNPKAEKDVAWRDSWQAHCPSLLRDNGFETAQMYDLKDKFLEHMDLMRYYCDQSVFPLMRKSCGRAADEAPTGS